MTQTENQIVNVIRSAAPLFQAYLECSDELQKHANEMFAALQDPNLSDEEKEFAVITLADILFPNMHEGDKMLGLDLSNAEEIAKEHHPESKAVLEKMDAEEETFAERLTSLMSKRGVTQVELADRIGVGQPAISMMMKRECRPQRRTVEKIANALGVSPSDLWPN